MAPAETNCLEEEDGRRCYTDERSQRRVSQTALCSHGRSYFKNAPATRDDVADECVVLWEDAGFYAFGFAEVR
jgi:hypothetical protein